MDDQKDLDEVGEINGHVLSGLPAAFILPRFVVDMTYFVTKTAGKFIYKVWVASFFTAQSVAESQL